MSNEKEENSVKLTTKVEDAPWWAKDIEAVLQPETRQLLEEYAGIPADQQIDHIERTVRSPSNFTKKIDHLCDLTCIHRESKPGTSYHILPSAL